MSARSICKFWIFTGTLLMTSIAYANQARFDGKGVVCPAESAVASDAEAEYGWLPEAAIFWFDDGKVTQIENVTNKNITLFDKTLKSANYYSNETELWFDLGYTYSFSSIILISPVN